MSGLVDNVISHLGDDQVAAIAARLGTDPAQARAAIEHAVPLIVGGMAQNASTAQGANALNNALGAHTGLDISSVLGNVLGGNGGSGIGTAILGHIFGANQAAASQGLGQATGMDQQSAGQLMAILAPIIMSALANRAQSHGLDAGSLGSMLGQEHQQIQQQGGLVGGLVNAVLNHGGGNFDLSHVLGGAAGTGGLGGLLGALSGR